jgi:hypothetical protein
MFYNSAEGFEFPAGEVFAEGFRGSIQQSKEELYGVIDSLLEIRYFNQRFGLFEPMIESSKMQVQVEHFISIGKLIFFNFITNQHIFTKIIQMQSNSYEWRVSVSTHVLDLNITPPLLELLREESLKFALMNFESKPQKKKRVQEKQQTFILHNQTGTVISYRTNLNYKAKDLADGDERPLFLSYSTRRQRIELLQKVCYT